MAAPLPNDPPYISLNKRVCELEEWRANVEKRVTLPSLAEESVCVPKARLAELERKEKEYKDDRSHGTEINDLIHECGIKSAYAGMTHVEGMLAAIREQRARIAALESSGADRYDEALADCLRSLRQVLDGGKVECPFDADLVVALSEVARLRDDNRTLEAEAVAAEELARESSVVAWKAGMVAQNNAMTSGTEAVNLQSIHDDINAAVDGHRYGKFLDAILAKARERLAARASAKPVSLDDFRRVGKLMQSLPDTGVPMKQELDTPTPDDGAFKSAEEDAELVAMGRQICAEWERANGLPPMPAGMLWNSTCHPYLVLLIEDDNLPCFRYAEGAGMPNAARKILRRVRREREASR